MSDKIRVFYTTGTYQQGDLERRQRLEDEDVQEFMRLWCAGRVPAWIGRQFRSLTGVALHPRMVASHARRMQDQGIIPAPWGYAQPTWQQALGWEPVGPPTVTAGGRVVQDYGGRSLATIRPNRAGRPPKHLANLGPAPDQMEGLSWREKRALRIAREREGTVAEGNEGESDHDQQPEPAPGGRQGKPGAGGAR